MNLTQNFDLLFLLVLIDHMYSILVLVLDGINQTNISENQRSAHMALIDSYKGAARKTCSASCTYSYTLKSKPTLSSNLFQNHLTWISLHGASLRYSCLLCHWFSSVSQRLSYATVMVLAERNVIAVLPYATSSLWPFRDPFHIDREASWNDKHVIDLSIRGFSKYCQT